MKKITVNYAKIEMHFKLIWVKIQIQKTLLLNMNNEAQYVQYI